MKLYRADEFGWAIVLRDRSLHVTWPYQGKESLAEVIREAIMVYNDLLKARKEGVDLYFQDSETGESGRIWILPGPPPIRRPRG